MNAIEILNRCRDAKADIDRLNDRLARLNECATSATGRIGQIGGRSNGVSDKVSAFAVDLVECEQRIADRRRAYEAELLAACKILDALPEPECGILYRYYVQAQTQRGIAQALNYSISYVKQKKREGVQAIANVPQDVVDGLLPAWYIHA